MRWLKTCAPGIALWSAAWALFASNGYAAERCTVCHSKDPKMVRMHAELEYKDCPHCHAPGRAAPPGEQRVRQMREGPLCMRCHGGKGPEKK